MDENNLTNADVLRHLSPPWGGTTGSYTIHMADSAATRLFTLPRAEDYGVSWEPPKQVKGFRAAPKQHQAKSPREERRRRVRRKMARASRRRNRR